MKIGRDTEETRNRVRTMCEKGKRMMKKLVIVIFGASGDLTKRKLMPALYTLYSGGRLPEGFTILGIGRTEYTDARYQEYIMSELGKFVASKEQVEDRMKDFCSHLHYLALDPARSKAIICWMDAYRSLPVRRSRITCCFIWLLHLPCTVSFPCI